MLASLQQLHKVRWRAGHAAELAARRVAPAWAQFRAWWSGTEPPRRIQYIDDPAEPADPVAPAAVARPAIRKARERGPEPVLEDPRWPARRIALVQRIWGAGFAEVGGAEFIEKLAKPLALTSAKSALDLTARLGGTGRTLFESFGVYVTGYEANAALADAAMEVSVQKGMAKKAPVEHYDPTNMKLKKRYDSVLAREGFYAGSHRLALLKTTVNALKAGGQMLLVDFVRAGEGEPSAAFTEWADSVPGGAAPWTSKQFETALSKLGMTLRIDEDITDEYRTLALRGWTNFLDGLSIGDLTRPEVLALIDEAERWMRRMAAFDSGDLRIYRFHFVR